MSAVSGAFDVSIHGVQRVALIEQLVHACRYTPGVVLLEGEAGASPVNFLRQMADLLRDELDFALLPTSVSSVMDVAEVLMAQWSVRRSPHSEEDNIQLVHHYLDVALQGGRLALIVVEHSSMLQSSVRDFLVSLMARHSRLTVLFAGIVDVSAILSCARQLEVPVSRIELPADAISPSVSAKTAEFARTTDEMPAVRDERGVEPPLLGNSLVSLDHHFIDESYEALSEDEGEEFDHLVADDRRERLTHTARGAELTDFLQATGSRLAALRGWGSATVLAVRQRSPWLPAVLVVACACLVLMVFLLMGGRQEQEPTMLVPITVQAPVSASALVAPVASEQPVVHEVQKPAVSQESVVEAKTVEGGAVGLESVKSEPVKPEPVEVEKAAAAKATENKPANSKAVEAGIKSKVLSADKAWSTRPDRFTVQVVAAHSEVGVRAVRTKLPQSVPSTIVKSSKDGKPWFVLVYGSFATRQEAVRAKDTLPTDVRKASQPWVRQQGEVFGHKLKQ